ncbi:MAG: DUF1778 domain-containing protein, partial [Propionivibrio sp.]
RAIKEFRMENPSVKENRLHIRCDVHARELLDRAATYAHVSVSEFVLSHALASAQEVIEANEQITLKPADFAAFLATLDAPAEPNTALQKALNLHADHVVR